jgi:hypothetical protein
VERNTALTRATVPPSEVQRIEDGHEVDSLAEADDYVKSLRERTTTTTTSTTTTTTTSLPVATSVSSPG